MKSKSITGRKEMPDKVDKRLLVNIDLYDHEITVIEDELEHAAPRLASKEMQKKLFQLKKELALQKEKLEKFRKSCDPQEDYTLQEPTGDTREANFSLTGEGFFEHLKAFENDFKNTRNKANELLDL